MVLNDADIRALIVSNQLIEYPDKPYDVCPEQYEQSIQPGSYDLTLGDDFKRIKTIDCIFPNKSYVELSDKVEYVEVPYYGPSYDGVTIGAGEFMLGVTNEIVNIPDDLSAFLEGRSSVGRAGLFIHNAGWIDSGFKGQIVLELYNCSPNPIRLTKDVRIAQIVFTKMTGVAENPYNGKYQNQKHTVGSRLYQDFIS